MASKQEKLYEALNLLEQYFDELEYGRTYNKFDQIVCKKKKALINYDAEEAEMIKAIRQFIREMVSVGVKAILKVAPSYKSLQKGLDYDTFKAWNDELADKVPQVKEHLKDRLIVPVTASYGKGFERGMEDIGLEDKKNTWFYLPGHAVPRLTNLRLINYISIAVSLDMATAIVGGLRRGENGKKIAQTLRKIQNEPRRVVVPPKIDPKTGKILRRGYEYKIPAKRYTEIIGRTEANRATVMGRVDAYRESGLVKSLIHITAGDRRVCPICEPLEGEIYSVDEARFKIPVHAMCRCTVEVNEYKTGADRNEARGRFNVDKLDISTNTAPLTNWSGASTIRDEIKRLDKHLKARGITTAEARAAYGQRLIEHMQKYGKVTQVNGFDLNSPQQLYALHTIKNARIYMQRAMVGEKGLEPTAYTWLKTSSRKANAYTTIRKSTEFAGAGHSEAYGTWLVGDKGFGIYREAREAVRTVFHEAGHNVYFSQSAATKKKFTDVYNATTGKGVNSFVSNRAYVNDKEDFAENFAFYAVDRNTLQNQARPKYDFLRDEILIK